SAAPATPPVPTAAARSAVSVPDTTVTPASTAPSASTASSATTAAAVTSAPAPEAAAGTGRGGPGTKGGAGAWGRWFTHELRPAMGQPGPREEGPWRVHVSGSYPYRDEAVYLFAADQEADRTLAVIGDLAAPGAMQVALRAAREALVTGRLVA